MKENSLRGLPLTDQGGGERRGGEEVVAVIVLCGLGVQAYEFSSPLPCLALVVRQSLPAGEVWMRTDGGRGGSVAVSASGCV